MIRSSLATYRHELHIILLTYRGHEVTELARRAGLSRASVYHLRANPRTNVRLDTIEKLEHAIGQRT